VTRPDPQPQPQAFDIDPDLDPDLDLDPAGLLERLQRAPTPTPPSRFGISAVLIEDLSKRDAHGKHWRHPDGRTYTAVIGRDLHYRRPDGTWDDVDLTLSPVQVGSGARARQVHVTRAPCPVVVDGDGQRVQVTDAQGRGIRYTLPVRPVVAADADGSAITFDDQGLTWTYRPMPRGLKLTATVPARLGARTFSFTYELLGGAAPLSAAADGALDADAFRIPAPTAAGSDGVVYRVGAWRVQGGALLLDYDDGLVPDQAFPLELDPTTTFSVAAGADDARIERTGSTYPPAGGISVDSTSTSAYCARSFISPTYYITVAIVRWDTSSLSGAQVQSATAKFYLSAKGADDNRQVTIEWYNWTPPASTSNWVQDAVNNAHAGTSIASLPNAAQYVSLALQNLSNLNTSGYTGLRLHVSGGQPTGSNLFQFRSFEHTGGTPPLLEVTYVAPVALSGSASGSTLTGAAQLTNLVQLGAGPAAGSTVTGAAALQTGLTASPAHGSTVTGAAALSLTLALSGNAVGGTAVPGAALWRSLLLGAGPVAGGTVVAPAAMPVRMAPVAVRAAHHPVLVILATTRPVD
jgi:hypothetical protein